jgi:Zn-dependent protease with chaperone function
MLAAGAGLFALLIALGAVAGRSRGASPRVAAGAHLVSLLGWGLVPVLWLACLGASLGSYLAGVRTSDGGCLLGFDRLEWQLLGLLPAAAVLGVVAWRSLRAAGAVRRAEMCRAVRAAAVRRPTHSGEVWIVASPRPVAFAAGLFRPRAVISSGLLAPLEEAERRAVCEHEAAHVRLGHPRLLLVGAAVAAAYGRFGPVRRAWAGLRRELEAAADDEAAAVVGAEAVAAALVRVALMAGVTARAGAAAFGDAEHLCYRLARLQGSCPVEVAPSVLVGLAAVVAGSAIALSGCLLAGAPASLLGVGTCLGAIAVVALRPAWRWGHWSPRR